MQGIHHRQRRGDYHALSPDKEDMTERRTMPIEIPALWNNRLCLMIGATYRETSVVIVRRCALDTRTAARRVAPGGSENPGPAQALANV